MKYFKCNLFAGCNLPSSCHPGGDFLAMISGIGGYRSWSLHPAGIRLYFMSGLEARYYFAINFILYRTVSQRQKDLSFGRLSASVAQTIGDDSLAEKLSVSSICFKENGTICLLLVFFYLCRFHNILVHCTALSQCLATCTTLYIYISLVHPFDTVFSAQRMPKKITIRFERDWNQKWSKWLK